MNVVLIKYSEIWLKGKNRNLFEDQLISNILSATGVSKEHLVRKRSRMYLIGTESIKALSKIFGIHAYTTAVKTSIDIEEIKETAVRLMEEKKGNAQTFAISSRKEEGYPMGTVEINTEVGTAVGGANIDLKVNLNNPDITIFIEIRDTEAFVYTSRDERRGPGGLPVGVGGKALALMSGGMDSPVGAYLSMKRGLNVDAIYFHAAPYTSKKAEEKVLDIARVLSEYNQGEIKVYVPSFGEIQKYITDNAPEDYWTILFRRSMRRIAENIEGYKALISGDNLAQVASQTIENLSVSEEGMKKIMLRPVIGYDKQEIMDLASVIGTYDISSRPYEDCCSVFTPSSPKTKSRWVEVEKIEKRLDLEEREKDVSIERYTVTTTTLRKD